MWNASVSERLRDKARFGVDRHGRTAHPFVHGVYPWDPLLTGQALKLKTRLREVWTAARSQIDKLLGTKAYLDLRVKVAKNWRRDPKQLGCLGF